MEKEQIIVRDENAKLIDTDFFLTKIPDRIFCLLKEKNEQFSNFLEDIAIRVLLSKYRGFNGGLDCVNNTSGVYSYVTKNENMNVMYHVSTELREDSKKFIFENNILIVFMDDGNQNSQISNSELEGFLASTVICVRKMSNQEKEKLQNETEKDQPMYFFFF